MANLERVVKCLMMTTSDNDSEALSAIRSANAMLKKEGLTWEKVIQSTAPKKSGAKTWTQSVYEDPVYQARTGFEDWFRREQAASAQRTQSQNNKESFYKSKKPWTPERAANFRMPFGKYQGSTIQELWRIDRGYVKWAAENMDGNAGLACQHYIKFAEILKTGEEW